MAGRKSNIEDQIKKQQDAVFKLKDRYENEVEKLNSLIKKQKDENRKKILKAFDKSGKTVEEVLAFLGYDEESDSVPVKRTRRRRIKKDQDQDEE
ncbi:hypothetical protein [Butyrivibrio sp. INlla14]|uniref:hypothetical protein n=1 Tax=Butyrivibrio sp. INlla14 TaxID=1520808 RepID=UPI000875FCE9|nr:hypothetical protein [Butyrivibrio sp. INlla14]SCY18536.1 hypothetical protein SAMN02910371_01339 [Butyrivibrio sp. INlla14]